MRTMCWSWPSARHSWTYLSFTESCNSQQQPVLYCSPQPNIIFSVGQVEDLHKHQSSIENHQAQGGGAVCVEKEERKDQVCKEFNSSSRQ